jgi:APA family basic amino acid/polyamine antiporter
VHDADSSGATDDQLRSMHVDAAPWSEVPPDQNTNERPERPREPGEPGAPEVTDGTEQPQPVQLARPEGVPQSASLARVLGLWGAVGMGLGSILGTGVFVSLAIAAGIAGWAVVPAVIVAGLLALANGLSSAQLAAAYPVSGGTYEYAHRLLHPAAGFAAGWTFLAAKSASAATAALGCAGYLVHTLGLVAGPGVRVTVALGLVIGITALVAGGLRRSNTANAAIVAVTMSALIAFVVAGAMSIEPAAGVARLGSGAGPITPGTISSVLEATALLFVAYTGYGRIATLGEEVIAPERTIPRAIIVTLALSMTLYVAVVTTAVASVGIDAFASSIDQGGAPLQAVARSFVVSQVWVWVAVGAITAMLGVLLNLLLGLSRVLLAMSRRGEMPRGLDHVDPRTKGPTRAVWAVGGVVAALVLVGDMKTTWSFSAFTVLVYYGLTNLSALRLPVQNRRYPRWIAALGLVSCVGLACFVDVRIWVVGIALLLCGFAMARALRSAR